MTNGLNNFKNDGKALNQAIFHCFSRLLISIFWYSIAIFVVLVVGTINSSVYAFNRQYDPGEIKIDFQQGTEINLQFELQIECLYYIGVGFFSKDPTSEDVRDKHIKSFFRDLLHLNLPAEIDIIIFNANHEIILDRKSFGGTKTGSLYGPNPVKFIAETINLKPGNYNVQLRVNELYKDFKDFEAFFFATKVPKTGCGDKYWWPSK